MYTQPRVSEQLKCTTKGPSFTQKDFKEKTGEIPMKALLRSFVVGLMLLGGYAGFTTNANATSTHVPGGVPFPPSN